jgi:predicted nuclease of predicted toxin-antitoxin system
VKFLIDNAVSPDVAVPLRAAGHDALHVLDRGMGTADDQSVIRLAVAEGRVIISADTDFGTLLVLQKMQLPSVILLRHGVPRRPSEQAAMLLANLQNIATDLANGAIVTFRGDRIRVRRLPMTGESTD